LIPAAATYKSNFPIAIPIPWTPRSPRPKILLPSVTTIISTCRIKRFFQHLKTTKSSDKNLMEKSNDIFFFGIRKKVYNNKSHNQVWMQSEHPTKDYTQPKYKLFTHSTTSKEGQSSHCRKKRKS